MSIPSRLSWQCARNVLHRECEAIVSRINPIVIIMMTMFHISTPMWWRWQRFRYLISSWLWSESHLRGLLHWDDDDDNVSGSIYPIVIMKRMFQASCLLRWWCRWQCFRYVSQWDEQASVSGIYPIMIMMTMFQACTSIGWTGQCFKYLPQHDNEDNVSGMHLNGMSRPVFQVSTPVW